MIIDSVSSGGLGPGLDKQYLPHCRIVHLERDQSVVPEPVDSNSVYNAESGPWRIIELGQCLEQRHQGDCIIEQDLRVINPLFNFISTSIFNVKGACLS